MRWKTILIGTAGLILLIVVGAGLALRSLDFNRYKSLIGEQVRAATGRSLTIGGKLNLKIGLSPAVVIENVSFANAPWGSRPEMVKVRRFEVEVALLPLLFRDIRVKRLILVEPDILLETDAGGTGNWSFSAAAPQAPPAAKAGEPSRRLPTLAAEKVRIEKGVLTYRDGRKKQAVRIALDRLDLQAKDATSPVGIDLAVNYAGIPIALAGTVGALQDLQAPPRPYPVHLTLKTGEATLEVEGTLARPLEAGGLDLKVRAKGPELAEVAKLAGKSLPAVGPFILTGQVAGSPDALSISAIDASAGRVEQALVKVTGAVKDALNARGIDMVVAVESKDVRAAAKGFGVDLPPSPPLSTALRVRDFPGGYAFEALRGSLGKSNLTGSGRLAIGGGRPRLTARLASTLLDLSELLPAQPGAARMEKAAGEGPERRIFPADPFPLDAFKKLDADLDLRVDRLLLPDRLAVESLVAHLVLSSGRLEIQPLSSRIGGGTVVGSLGLDASAGKSAALAIRIEAKAVDLAQALQQMGHPDLVSGTRMDVTLNLKGGGASVQELMAGLNGDVLVILGQGKIQSKFVEWLGADLLTQIVEKINPFGAQEAYTDLKCGVIRLAAKDGVASTDKGIAFETSRMTLVSSGTVNLKSEAIDFSLRPDTHQGIGIGAGELIKLLRVRGTMSTPKFSLDEIETAKRAVSIGAAVATAGVSFLAETLARRALADSQPCQTALAKTSGPVRSGAAPSAEAPAAETAPKPGNGIGQFFRGLFGQ